MLRFTCLRWTFAVFTLALLAGTSAGLPPNEDHRPAVLEDIERPDELAGEDNPQPTPPPRVPDLSRLATVQLGREPREAVIASDHVVVRFEENVPTWQRRQITAAAGGLSLKTAEFGRFSWVTVAAGDTPEGLAARLKGIPGVLAAEVDPLVWPAALAVAPKRVPTDPFFSVQWHHQRIGLPETLDRNTRLGEGVVVAVIDSGVAFGSGNSFPSRRGVDLEGVRFLPGRDFVDGGEPFDRGVGPQNLSVPRFGHGTFAASQIAAGIDNGSGAGIAPRVTILPIRVLPVRGGAPFSIVAEAVDFAVAAGAKVINLSLGGPQGSGLMEAAIERAHRAGVVIVASAGNDAEEPGRNEDVGFPARYPRVIAVGATRFEDSRASYSNFGPGLDLMAPAGDNAGRLVGPNQRDGVLATSFLVDLASGQAFYGGLWANGTSFSAPQVAAAAALLISLGVRDPDAVRAVLEGTVRDLASPGFDTDTGLGQLDLAAAHRGIGLAF